MKENETPLIKPETIARLDAMVATAEANLQAQREHARQFEIKREREATMKAKREAERKAKNILHGV